MKLEEPKNRNYSARVVRIRATSPLAGRDRIVAVSLLGFQAIVGVDTQVGEVGIVFPAECQLSEEFAGENDLFRHETYNKDTTKKGYLEDNRRVRAIKFGGHRSDCLYMPLSSLEYTGADLSSLNEGDEFDQLNGHEICKKYVVVKHVGSGRTQSRPNVFARVDERLFPEMFDITQYHRVSDSLDPDMEVVVTQKLHGTSIRIANIPVNRRLSVLERVLRRLGVKVRETTYDSVYGSRRVIKGCEQDRAST